MSGKALKFDGDKTAWSLAPWDALEQVILAFQYGAEKYAAYNYSLGMEWRRIWDALIRHSYAWLRGRDTDEESGLPHLAHAGACVLMLLHLQLRGAGTDDRPAGAWSVVDGVEPAFASKHGHDTNVHPDGSEPGAEWDQQV